MRTWLPPITANLFIREHIVVMKNFKSKKFDDPKMLRRAVGFLQRRGYTNKVIFALLKQPLEDD